MTNFQDKDIFGLEWNKTVFLDKDRIVSKFLTISFKNYQIPWKKVTPDHNVVLRCYSE